MRFSERMTVFNVSVAICALVSVYGLFNPLKLARYSSAITQSSLQQFDWFFLLTCSTLILVSAYLAFGKYGSIKIGKESDQPEYKTASWLAMLFAAGMGSGLVFWGVAEPLTHFTANTPGAPEEVFDRARWSLVLSNLHWGFHAWAIYAVSALTIGYFAFRKRTTMIASGPILYTYKGKLAKGLGGIADTLAILSVVFGVVGALGMGTLLIRHGLHEIFGTSDHSFPIMLAILLCLSVAMTISALSGLSRGIQILSNMNIIMAIALLLFVLFSGPTHFLLSVFTTSIGDYLSALPLLSTRLFPFSGNFEWSHGWILTYLIWWIAWAPFVGIFIARISKGRTIREFITGVVLVPTAFSILWFAVFGGAGLHFDLYMQKQIGQVAVSEPSMSLFALLSQLPLSSITITLSLILMFFFLVTSADSACFVLSVMSTKGSLNPSNRKKIIWSVIMTMMVAASLASNKGANALKALAITGAIPFTLILILHIICLFKALNKENLQQ